MGIIVIVEDEINQPVLGDNCSKCVSVLPLNIKGRFGLQFDGLAHSLSRAAILVQCCFEKSGCLFH